MNPLNQAIERLQENLSLVKNCWNDQRQRGLGAVKLPLDDTPTYLIKTEINLPDCTTASIYLNLAIDQVNPDWILAVVEVREFLHENFSWQLLGLDERDRIQIYNLPFGFQPHGTESTIFIGAKRTIVQHRSTEGIESVSFFERGGKA